jgi:chromosome partitioning protein
VKEAREINPHLRAIALLNEADAQGRDNEEALEALKSVQDLELLEVFIGRRKSFPNAAAAGRAVIEHSPKDQKAVEELNALVQVLYNGKI